MVLGILGDSEIKEHCHQQCRRHQFDPWMGKMSWEKAMATHSSIAWAIPWTEVPGGLQCMGSKKSQTHLSS